MGSPNDEKDRYSNEEPQHVVTIGKAFAVGKLRVTVGQFAAFVREMGTRLARNAGPPKAALTKNASARGEIPASRKKAPSGGLCELPRV
jgi:formylglycine-generating enzyme required for sulfatase activity